MLIQADAFHLPYANNIFHAIVTSPPYWGLRKYSGEQGRAWGGDPDCEHRWGDSLPARKPGQVPQTKWKDNTAIMDGQSAMSGRFCQSCGAWYGSLGLEPAPGMYIQNMVEILRDVRRVLRPDGVVWLNLGDCFANITGTVGSGKHTQERRPNLRRGAVIPPQGNLMLMPHRLAIALQADGWIVRNDLIWYKRNPMPESISGWHWHRHRLKDENDKWYDCSGCEKCLHDNPSLPPLHILSKSSWRHTRQHENVFQLVKGMGYYCNQEAVREALDPASIARISQANFANQTGGPKDYATTGQSRYRSARQALEGLAASRKGRNPRSVLGDHTPALEAFHYWLMENFDFDLNDAVEQFKYEATNPTDVLDVPTAPYGGSHYATFPPKLIAPLIQASVPRRCCPACGQGWAAVIERQDVVHKREVAHQPGNTPTKVDSTGWKPTKGNVTGYRPTCDCGREDYVPGIVLDPFGGSGTTGMVAKQLMRRWVVTDISRPYLDEQAKVRTKTGTPTHSLDGLPLFGGEIQTKTMKQDELGKHTYTGFNKRWEEKHGK